MSTTNPDQHIIRVRSSSYGDLPHLLNSEPITVHRPGPRGTTYALKSGLTVTALDDRHVQIGSTVITAEITALPSHAYAAVIRASPAFQQYPDITALYDQLRAPDFAITTFTGHLADTVNRGRQPDTTPRLIHPHRELHATWQPNATYFRRTPAGEWFISLAFHLAHRAPAPHVPRRAAFGLDLGSNPVIAAASTDGHVHAIGRPLPAHLQLKAATASHTGPARELLRTLTYATGRADADTALYLLLSRADLVFAERLTLHGLSAGFVAGGRLQASLDFHYSWLPQTLWAARIPFHRVNPAYTSQICHLHGLLGKRVGKRFACPECTQVQHADINAARTILERGLGSHDPARWNRRVA